jgi:8-oxo-dGTP pyrophosphatase MutT (NUDIX family)
MKKIRPVLKTTEASVTNFLYFGDEYLFMKRKLNAKIMPSQLNGVGGKLLKGEDYISAAIRETKEETGYKVKKSQIKFCGLIKFENKTDRNWITCFFKIKVASKRIPLGTKTREGKLLWIYKNKALNSNYGIADDLNYIWEDIISEKNIFFLTAEVKDNNFRIVNINGQKLKLR